MYSTIREPVFKTSDGGGMYLSPFMHIFVGQSRNIFQQQIIVCVSLKMHQGMLFNN